MVSTSGNIQFKLLGQSGEDTSGSFGVSGSGKLSLFDPGECEISLDADASWNSEESRVILNPLLGSHASRLRIRNALLSSQIKLNHDLWLKLKLGLGEVGGEIFNLSGLSPLDVKLYPSDDLTSAITHQQALPLYVQQVNSANIANPPINGLGIGATGIYTEVTGTLQRTPQTFTVSYEEKGEQKTISLDNLESLLRGKLGLLAAIGTPFNIYDHKTQHDGSLSELDIDQFKADIFHLGLSASLYQATSDFEWGILGGFGVHLPKKGPDSQEAFWRTAFAIPGSTTFALSHTGSYSTQKNLDLNFHLSLRSKFNSGWSWQCLLGFQHTKIPEFQRIDPETGVLFDIPPAPLDEETSNSSADVNPPETILDGPCAPVQEGENSCYQPPQADDGTKVPRDDLTQNKNRMVSSNKLSAALIFQSPEIFPSTTFKGQIFFEDYLKQGLNLGALLTLNIEL